MSADDDPLLCKKSAAHATPYYLMSAIEKINTPRVMPVANPAS